MDVYTGHTPAEMVLQAVIQGGIASLQENEIQLRRLIQRYQPETQDAILNYFLKNEIAVRLGFALEPFELPQISIVLSSETEQRFIGDELAVRDAQFDVVANTGLAVLAQTPAPFDLPYVNLQNGAFPDVCRIKIDNEFLTYDAVTPTDLHIVARHVRRTAQANHSQGATITAWQLEREIGVHQMASYRLDVLHANADIVIFLQQVVKWALLLSWEALDDEGFTEMQLSGSDFMPRPQFYPMFIYMRSLTLSTRISEGVPQPMVEALSLQTFPTITGTTINFNPELP